MNRSHNNHTTPIGPKQQHKNHHIECADGTSTHYQRVPTGSIWAGQSRVTAGGEGPADEEQQHRPQLIVSKIHIKIDLIYFIKEIKIFNLMFDSD